MAKQLKGIKAVFFDAGGTLFQPYPSVGDIYSEVAARHGLVAAPEELERIFHEAWVKRDGLASLSTAEGAPGLPGGPAAVPARGFMPRAGGGEVKRSRPLTHSGEKQERKWWHALVLEVFSGVGQIDDFESFFEELYDRFARPEAWRLFPDALPALQELKKRGKTIGIVSNWDSRLFGICEGLGLRRYLDFVLASAVVGAAKPHPKIFQEALRHAKVDPSEAVHVGDSLEDDVLGAQRAGIHAVFIDRKGNRTSQAPTISALQFLWGLFEN